MYIVYAMTPFYWRVSLPSALFSILERWQTPEFLPERGGSVELDFRLGTI